MKGVKVGRGVVVVVRVWVSGLAGSCSVGCIGLLSLCGCCSIYCVGFSFFFCCCVCFCVSFGVPYECGIGVIFGNVFSDCFFGVIGFVGLAVLCGCVDCVVSGCISGVVCWLAGTGMFLEMLFSGAVMEVGVGCVLYRIRKYLPNSYTCLGRCCINFMH